jgi:hypothetical protein
MQSEHCEGVDEMEEISQLALVVVFAVGLLVSGQQFMEHRSKAFDRLGVAAETSRAVKKGAAFSRYVSGVLVRHQSEALVGLVQDHGL